MRTMTITTGNDLVQACCMNTVRWSSRRHSSVGFVLCMLSTPHQMCRAMPLTAAFHRLLHQVPFENASCMQPSFKADPDRCSNGLLLCSPNSSLNFSIQHFCYGHQTFRVAERGTTGSLLRGQISLWRSQPCQIRVDVQSSETYVEQSFGLADVF